MSLVFAAFTPHPPLSIPAIGHDATQQLKATTAALQHLEQDLYAAKPDTLIIISPHGPILTDSFVINLANNYTTDLSEFGDLGTKLEFKPNVRLIEAFRGNMEGTLPVTITSEPQLDYGAAVPLYHLTQHLPPFTIVPISYSLLDYATHIRFGQSLKEQISATNQRVAIIASGDLSHRLSKDSPAGFDPAGAELDAKITDAIRSRSLNDLLAIDHNLIDRGAECGLRSLFILLGVLSETNYQTQILSYEAPFGVGYLTVHCTLM